MALIPLLRVIIFCEFPTIVVRFDTFFTYFTSIRQSPLFGSAWNMRTRLVVNPRVHKLISGLCTVRDGFINYNRRFSSFVVCSQDRVEWLYLTLIWLGSLIMGRSKTRIFTSAVLFEIIWFCTC